MRASPADLDQCGAAGDPYAARVVLSGDAMRGWAYSLSIVVVVAFISAAMVA